MSVPTYAEDIVVERSSALRIVNVDIINRNQRIGEFMVADISFVKWLEVPEDLAHVDSVIGLTKDGIVFQVVMFEGRRVARRLSGDLKFTDLAMSSEGLLIASKADGQVYIFDNTKWMKSPILALVKRGFGLWAAMTVSTTAVAFMTYEVFAPIPNHSLFTVLSLTSSVTSALGTALATALTFGEDNENRNGFFNSNLRVVEGASLGASLKIMLEDPSVDIYRSNFAAGCADDFLPRPGNGAHTNHGTF